MYSTNELKPPRGSISKSLEEFTPDTFPAHRSYENMHGYSRPVRYSLLAISTVLNLFIYLFFFYCSSQEVHVGP